MIAYGLYMSPSAMLASQDITDRFNLEAVGFYYYFAFVE